MVIPVVGSYDAHVPNKTIYVSQGDLALYQRAQELAGDNLSAAISAALKRYVDIEEGKREGYDEIKVRVGTGKGRRVRFTALLMGEWANSNNSGFERFRVWRGRTGKYVLHIEREAQFTATDSQGKPAGWRGWVGLGDVKYGSSPKESTIEVVPTLEELEQKVPAELFAIVARSAQQPVVEELDI